MILVTGADGFIGRAVCERLRAEGYRLRMTARNIRDGYLATGPIDGMTDWSAALQSVTEIVHCAGRAHVMNETAADSLGEFRRINVDATENLARQAASSGVKRIVYLSSIKVNGERNAVAGRPFREEDTPAPIDAYGISKLEAENALKKISAQTGLEVVVIRPVLVYGPGVKGNFSTLLRAVSKGWLLPFGSIRNMRSFVSLDNLVDLILSCVTHPKAANETFLASDGDDISTSELIRRVSISLDRPARLLPVPPVLLKMVAAIMGRGDMMGRLCDSLQVDISKARRITGWHPPRKMEETLTKMATRTGLRTGG